MKSNFLAGEIESGVFHLFYNEGQGLCYKEKKGKEWDEYKIILRDIAPDFDVASWDGNLYVIGQDTMGTIIYLEFSEGNWRKRELLASKSRNTLQKGFRIIVQNGVVNAFYLLDYLGKTLLAHHMVGDSDSPPNILGYVDGGVRSFGVCADALKNIHVLYKENGEAVHKTFVWSKKAWAQQGGTGIGGINPLIYCDEEGIIFYYTQKAEGGYRTFFHRKGYDKKIISIDPAAPRASLFKYEGAFYYAGFLHESPFAVKSYDNGESWERVPFGELFSPYGAATGIKLRMPHLPAAELPGVATAQVVKPFLLPEEAFRKNKAPVQTAPVFPPKVEAPPAPSETEIEVEKLKIKVHYLEGEIRNLKSMVSGFYTPPGGKNKEYEGENDNKDIKEEAEKDDETTLKEG